MKRTLFPALGATAAVALGASGPITIGRSMAYADTAATGAGLGILRLGISSTGGSIRPADPGRQRAYATFHLE
jgi:hypothetical protein